MSTTEVLALNDAVENLNIHPHGRDAITAVAKALARQLHLYGIPRHTVTTRDVRVALAVHGSDPTYAQAQRNARIIAGLIRSDFSV